MTRRRDKRIIPLCTGLFVALFAFVFLINRNNAENADAADLSKFDPGNIISDYMMSNYNSMTEAEIQQFLTSKNSCNNRDHNYYNQLSSANPNISWHWKDDHFVCLSEELFGDGMVIGEGKTAAKIIYETAQKYKINPQSLIVLIEKESGLITDPIPNSYDYRTMTGFGCPDTAPCDSKYFGFKNQLEKAAALFREVLDGGWTNYPLGENYIQYNPDRNCGGSVVNIKNLATSSLYRYTPYQPNAATLAAGRGTAHCGAYGNRNFYSYFSDWFGDPVKTIGYESFITPRDMVALKDSKRINPFTLEQYDTIKAGTVLNYSSKIKIGEEWYYRTRDHSNKGEDVVVSASAVGEIQYESIQPTYIQLKNNTTRLNPFNDVAYDRQNKGAIFKITSKIKKSDGWYYRTESCETHNIDAVIRKTDSLIIQFIAFQKPRYMEIGKNAYMYDMTKNMEKSVAKEGERVKFSQKVELIDGWYYASESNINNNIYLIIPASSVKEIEYSYINFEKPRYLVISKNTNTYNPYTKEKNGTKQTGKIEKYDTKINFDGKWYYRTVNDTKDKKDIVVPAEALDELQYLPFENPRYLVLMEDTERVNPFTNEVFDRLEKGRTLKYTSKIIIGSQWYYRTEYMTNKNEDVVVPASSVMEK